MESDIILEGFRKAEQQHGLQYINFIGDGDSSVHIPSLYQEYLAEGTSYPNKNVQMML